MNKDDAKTITGDKSDKKGHGDMVLCVIWLNQE